jgi:hypothetical protein
MVIPNGCSGGVSAEKKKKERLMAFLKRKNKNKNKTTLTSRETKWSL